MRRCFKTLGPQKSSQNGHRFRRETAVPASQVISVQEVVCDFSVKTMLLYEIHSCGRRKGSAPEQRLPEFSAREQKEYEETLSEEPVLAA